MIRLRNHSHPAPAGLDMRLVRRRVRFFSALLLVLAACAVLPGYTVAASPAVDKSTPPERQEGAAGAFFADSGIPLLDVALSTSGWGDYDSDGGLDLLYSGCSYRGALACEEHRSKLYRNAGSSLEDVTAALFPGDSLPRVPFGSLAWGDYDNDGRLDFLIMGATAAHNERVTRLYHNTGAGFEDRTVLIPAVPQLAYPAVAWGDYDNDGWSDLLLTGHATTSPQTEPMPVGKLYRNTGAGFEDVSSIVPGLPQIYRGSVAWGDYDNDGRLDFLISGGFPPDVSRLYHNTGAGFEDVSSIVPGLPQLRFSSLAWGDYDNDGRLDFMVTGMTSSPSFAVLSRLYRNTGAGFEDVSAIVPDLPQVYVGTLDWADYDNDGRLDFSITGSVVSPQFKAHGISRLYRNTGAPPNSAPSPPQALNAAVAPGLGSAMLSWSAATDGQTPTSGLSYNLRVGTSPAGSDVFSSMAEPGSGLRRLPARGPAQTLSFPLRGLTLGRTYYWSVQAIDSAFAGGEFAGEGTFTACFGTPSDVHEGDYYYEGVKYLTCPGYIRGYDDGTFRPYSFATRAQLVKILVLAKGWDLLRPASPTFADLPPEDPFYEYVETAVAHGIIAGYDDGTFRPYANVTRGQTTRIVVLAQDWSPQVPEEQSFSDVPPRNPFYRYIETAHAHNVIKGYADGTFRWRDDVTRGQLARIIHAAVTGAP